MLLTGPLLPEKLAASITGYYQRPGNYVRDLLRGEQIDGARSRLLRAKLLFTPNEQLTLKLTGQYAQRDDPLLVNSATLDGNSVARLVPGSFVATQPYTSTQDPQSKAVFTEESIRSYEIGIKSDRTAVLAFDIAAYFQDYSNMSGFDWTFGGIFKQAAYHVMNAQARWSVIEDRLTLSVWGKNLTNELYGLAHGIGEPAAAISWAPPRTFGVSAEYAF